MRPVADHGLGGNRADHFVSLAAPGDRAGEIHQPAAFGVGRHPRGDRGLDLGAQRRVGGERRGLGLGEAAADEEGVGGGQALIAQGVEKDQARAGAPQRLEIVLVIEPERGVARHRDAQVRSEAKPRAAWVRSAPRGVRDGEQAIDVDPARDDVARARDGAQSIVGLARRRQPEVSLLDPQPFVAADRAEHGDVGVALERLTQLAFLPREADLVEDHAANLDARSNAA